MSDQDMDNQDAIPCIVDNQDCKVRELHGVEISCITCCRYQLKNKTTTPWFLSIPEYRIIINYFSSLLSKYSPPLK